MTQVGTITKVLGTAQDLLLGLGQEAQIRGGVLVTVDRLAIPLVFETIAAIKALNPAKVPIAKLLGLYPKEYYYDVSSTATPDDNLVLLPASGVGRWLRAVSDLTELTIYVDEQLTLKAPLESPTFTGAPTGPTPNLGANNTELANTEFVQQELVNSTVKLVSTIAQLSTIVNPTAGKIVTVAGYHADTPGIGGGNFIEVVSSATVDNGSVIASATTGRRWLRKNPKRTPYEFGYKDGDVNAALAINACTAAYGDCYIDRGKTYDITTMVRARKLHAVGGKAALNCVSPTANNRFGEFGAAVYCSPNFNYGTTTSTGLLAGVDIQNIIVHCNGLINSTGSVGLKGIYNYRNDDFYIRACDVYDCASYAFWAHEDATTGTLYCSGTYDDCYAEDSQVSFEQVNCRGVVLNNCVGYLSASMTAATYAEPIECIFHPYGGDDLRVVYNNCIGIADGYCPSVYLALLACKNVSANDCQFINNNDGGAAIQAAVILEGSGASSFDNVNFNNCKLKSVFSNAVRLTPGATGGAEAAFKFNRCEIDGYQLGVYCSGSGGRYSFVDCNTTARATLAVTPIAYQVEAGYTSVQITGGTATATTTGSGTPVVSNLPRSIFNGTILSPNTGALPVIRQRVVGTAVFGGDGSTYANLNVVLPSAVLGWTSAASNTTKMTASIQVDYGVSGAADFPAAVAMAYPTVVTIVANDTVRFVANNVLQGKTARYEITEWE